MNATPPSSKVVLTTGAAGGLGRGLCAAFAAQGWRVVAGCHSTPTWEATESIWPVPLDVTNPGRVAETVELILSRWRRIDALVNNAGVTANQPAWQISDADWDRVIAVNLKGAFLCSREVLPVMLRQQDGHIINIASFSARHGTRGQANYAAAKAGLIGLTESLAREVGGDNVRVNAVLPGVMRTAMTAKLTEPQLAEIAEANVLHRLNSIDEVAGFVALLASLRNVSGQLFQLDSRISRWT